MDAVLGLFPWSKGPKKNLDSYSVEERKIQFLLTIALFC